MAHERAGCVDARGACTAKPRIEPRCDLPHGGARAVRARCRGGRLVDVGCGSAGLWRLLAPRFDSYCGLDAVRYDGFPVDAEFCQVDLDAARWPVAPGEADVVAAVETIEHLENPWAFMRALVDLARPGGWIMVTTPNQLSVLSVATLIVKRRFSSFQDVHYPGASDGSA